MCNWKTGMDMMNRTLRCLFGCFAVFLSCVGGENIYAEETGVGLIGGFVGSTPAAYGAIVVNGSVSSNILSASTSLNSVALNDLGVGLVGGAHSGVYSVVSHNGVSTTVTPITPDQSASRLNYVAINSSGVGLIGGTDASLNTYVAVVSGGVATAVSNLILGSVIEGVAISDSGMGIIGGSYRISAGPLAYAALVSGGVASSNLLALDANSEILSVAINSSDVGLIGGYDTAGGAYVAIIYNGTVYPLSLSLSGSIESVAINDSGVGLIGGIGNGGAYAARLVISGTTATVTPIPGLPTGNALIYSVAIDSYGAGIIGGRDGNNTAFAALVDNLAVPTTIDTSLGSGSIIYSASINDFGFGLIGGIDGTGLAYAALVDDQGVPTRLVQHTGQITSVSLSNYASVPITISGFRLNDDFVVVSELFNVLSWNNPLPQQIASYQLLRNGTLIALLGSNATSYEDHNRLCTETDVYILNAYDALDNLLGTASITIYGK